MLQGAALPVASVTVCWRLTGDPAPVRADAPGLWVRLEHPQAWDAAQEGKLHSEMGRKHRNVPVLLEGWRERCQERISCRCQEGLEAKEVPGCWVLPRYLSWLCAAAVACVPSKGELQN